MPSKEAAVDARIGMASSKRYRCTTSPSGSLSLAPVVAWCESDFFAKQLGEMARVGVANIVSNGHDTGRCFAKHAPRCFHAQLDVVLRRRYAGRLLGQPVEMRFSASPARLNGSARCSLIESIMSRSVKTGSAEPARWMCQHPHKGAPRVWQWHGPCRARKGRSRSALPAHRASLARAKPT